jgi:hypothetical protein
VLRTNELQVWFLSEYLVDMPMVKAEPASVGRRMIVVRPTRSYVQPFGTPKGFVVHGPATVKAFLRGNSHGRIESFNPAD